MNDQAIMVYISGYWRDVNRHSILTLPGILFVFESLYNPETRRIKISSTFFVEHAQNIREGILLNSQYNSWLNALKPGHELCYGAGITEKYYIQRAEAAFIHFLKPLFNRQKERPFSFETTRIICTGKNDFVGFTFEVKGDYPEYLLKKHTLHLKSY